MTESNEALHVCSCGGNCGCQEEESDVQHISRDEYISRLEDYLTRLREEIVLVEDELADLRQTA